jgi:hypothetical protein
MLHADPPSIDRLREVPAPIGGPLGHALAGSARSRATAATVRAALPAVWCGTPRSSDDTENELANGGVRYHAIYAVPQGSVNRFATVAGALQTDAFQASALLERQYRRAIRFDMGTDCGPQYLDISVVSVPQRAEALTYRAADPDALMSLLADELRAQGFPVSGLELALETAPLAQKNFVVWLEDVKPAGGVCGLGNQFYDMRRDQANYNNYAGKFAVVFRGRVGFCKSNTVRHEIGHNLGALQSRAPNAFDGAHCDDAYEDTMCYPNAPRVSSDNYQSEFFDYRNDDYWDPAGGALSHWTVNLSRFICPDIACNVPERGIVDKLLEPLLGSCPEGVLLGSKICSANTTTDTATEVVLRPGPATKVKFKARRAGRKRWRITIQVTGSGAARVSVRCRRGRGTVRILHRQLSAPTTLRKHVRCDGRPTALAKSSGG